jgi:putative flippase GtrA
MSNTNKSEKDKSQNSKNSNSKIANNLDVKQSKNNQQYAQKKPINSSTQQNANKQNDDVVAIKPNTQTTPANLKSNAGDNQTKQNVVDVDQSKQPTKLTKKQEIGNLIKFVLFSISAGVIQILSFTLLNELIIKDIGNQYGWSYFISLTLSVLWNFTINRKFTFKSANNIPLAMLLVFAYYCVFTPLSIWWGNALTQAHWNEYLVLLLTMIINMATEFLWCRFVVYKNSINSAKK